MPHRVSSLYASVAKEDGSVTRADDDVLEVTYKNGEKEAFQLGRRFGSIPALMIPHELKAALGKGARFKKGDILTFNERYFELDPLDHRQALMKAGVLMNTAFMETPDTLEDSSAVTLEAAKLLGTQIAKVRDLIVSFDQAIHNLVKPGDRVDSESILCTIEDPITADQKFFDETSVDTLKLLAANAPHAKVTGVVEKIEVFYNGEIDELTPTLKKIAQTSDAERRKWAHSLHQPVTTGRVTEMLRVEGKPILPSQAVIRVYITTDVPYGVGDFQPWTHVHGDSPARQQCLVEPL